jgi:hypothetical protein
MEVHWWEVLVDLITIVLVAGKLLEPLWGAIEVSCRVLEKKNVFEKRKMFL